MKFSIKWLRQYVDFEWSAQELAERLTFAGIEVESVTSIGGGPALEQVVVCQVLSSEKHPDADRLSVCRVSDGATERQIVCGAKNYKVGDKVALALPGVRLPGGLTIKAAKLRGVESQGMMCSAKELGLSEEAEGLLILPADAPVGARLGEVLGGADTVLDIEVTPNRPDWLSVIGVAREVSALTGSPLRLPAVELAEGGDSTESLTSVRVEAADLCRRYAARVVRGVKIAPSPAWLRQRLASVGMRSINNVVDVTNYVLLECGHPLHAFDYNLLAGHRIVVRRAVSGERFVAIDGSTQELTDEMLVIADAERPVALAGIMGGRESEIQGGTTDVLLESAWFLPANIRRTSRRLGLSSESSYRFERGADIGNVIWAGNRAAALIRELAGGEVARGVIDVLAGPVVKRRVRCRFAQVNRVLGIAVPPEAVRKIFSGLSLPVMAADAEGCEVEAPTFRVDIEREADLIEEVCRVHGVEQIPAAMQPAKVAVSDCDARWDALMRVRHVLAALGFDEAQNQTMVGEGVLKLVNPLTAEMSALRSELTPGLVANLRTNVSRHQYDVRLFEIGRVFGGDGGESWRLALAMTGRRAPGSWESGAREEKLDYYDLKGALEELAAQSGCRGFAAAEIRQISAAQAKRLGLWDEVFTAELELEPLWAAPAAERRFVELPRFPAVVRDMALVVEESVGHGQIVAVIEKHRNMFLERVELFDIFRGGTIPRGKKSLAYSLVFRAPDRTLTDAEVNEAHEQLKRQMRQELRCEIREG
jgi:phenylalanyl-tRNA synthetase beta chain